MVPWWHLEWEACLTCGNRGRSSAGERDVETSVLYLCALPMERGKKARSAWSTETCRETGFTVLAEATARTLDALNAADRAAGSRH
jgi:hypothetical protein